MASIYRRNGTYYVKFYQNGRRIRRTLNTNKKHIALKLKERIERELAAGQYDLDPADTDVTVFWEEYTNWAVNHKRPTTIQTETKFWQQLIAFCSPSKLSHITRKDIERFKAQRIKDGLKPNSVNDTLRHLQAILNHARKLGHFSGPNPVQGVARLPVDKNPPKYLTKDQIKTVMSKAEQGGRDILLVYALGIYAGLRKNEIANARWEWFDFDQKLITLTSHEGFWLKDSESRTIPLHDRLSQVLMPYRQKEGFVFVSNRPSEGRHAYRYEFKRAFNTVKQRAGVEWVTPHVLRHTFASQLAIAGVSLYKISKWLGHSDVKTTQIYAHLQTHDEDINRF